MQILLIGGTGAMGKYLAPLLAQNKHQVVVTSRNQVENEKRIKYIQGNAKELDFLENLLHKKWDVVVDFMNYSVDEFKERVDLLLNSTHQYIFLSSARVYDDSVGRLTEESDRLLDNSDDEVYLSTSDYALNKARQENILTTSKKMNWTIIRPYITYSDNRIQLGTLEKENWLYRALKGRTIVFSKDIKEHYTTLTYGNDVAKGIQSLIGNEETLGEIFHITNNTSISWEKVLDIYLEVLDDKLGYKPRVIYQELPDFIGWYNEVYPIIYDRLFNREFDNKKVNQHINTNDFIEVEVGLKDCLESFLNNPEFSRINWKSEAKKDKIANEKTPINEINGLKRKIKYFIYRYIL